MSIGRAYIRVGGMNRAKSFVYLLYMDRVCDGELVLVFDDGDEFADFRGAGVQVGDFGLGCLHYLVGPEAAAARDGAPLAGHRVFFDVGFDCGYVLEFKVCYVCASVEEEWLAVAAILCVH